MLDYFDSLVRSDDFPHLLALSGGADARVAWERIAKVIFDEDASSEA